MSTRPMKPRPPWDQKEPRNLIDVQNAKLYCDGEEIGEVRFVERIPLHARLVHTTRRNVVEKAIDIMSTFSSFHKWEIRSDSLFGPLKWTGHIQRTYPDKICMTAMAESTIPDLEVYTLEITVEPESKEPRVSNCPWVFGSRECNVKGVFRGQTCNKTFDDCKANGNEARFGGFPLGSKEVSPGSPYNDKYKEIRQMIINDIQSNGPIRKAIRDVYG